VKHSKEDLIKYRIQRAHESLNEAILLAENHYWNTVANRLYYACFYIVNALFSQSDILTKSHSGTKTEFYRYFIKTSIFDRELGRTYSELFDKRQECDYQDFHIFEKEDVDPYIEKVEIFIKLVEQYISEALEFDKLD
jgi:uncharacterized protein (UPF0332 family)